MYKLIADGLIDDILRVMPDKVVLYDPAMNHVVNVV